MKIERRKSGYLSQGLKRQWFSEMLIDVTQDLGDPLRIEVKVCALHDAGIPRLGRHVLTELT